MTVIKLPGAGTDHNVNYLEPQRAWIETLALSIFHREKPNANFMVMTAYLDESGTHGAESPAVIVAGFLSDVAGWAAYERELADLFSRYKVKTFHAQKLRRRSGDFKEWGRTRRAKFNAEFLQLADENLTAGFSVILPLPRYEEIYKAGEIPRKVRQDTQYGLCFRVFLWVVLRFMADRKDDWPVNVVFEAGHANSGDALRVFNEVQSQFVGLDGALDMMVFARKDASLPLSAADALAYATYRSAAGSASHPIPNVLAAGPADPPYIVSRVPMLRIEITSDTLTALREELLAGYARTKSAG